MVMKVKLNESKFNSVFSDWLKKHGITIDILYWRDNCVDSITGTVYLYKQKEILGYKHGYGFDFKYDKNAGSGSILPINFDLNLRGCSRYILIKSGWVYSFLHTALVL